MNIGIIGAGMIGGTLANLLANRGHRVQVATRSPDDPRLATLPPGVSRVTTAEAACFGIATIVAVPFAAWSDLANSVEAGFDERVILDTSNAIPVRDGEAAVAALSSGQGSGNFVATLVPGARVVKAFSSVHFASLAAMAGAHPPIGIPLAGDDPALLPLRQAWLQRLGSLQFLSGRSRPVRVLILGRRCSMCFYLRVSYASRSPKESEYGAKTSSCFGTGGSSFLAVRTPRLCATASK